MHINFIGASGLLGRYLVPMLKKQGHIVDTPKREQLDITKPIENNKLGSDTYDLIFLSAAYTDVAKAEKERRLCYETNVDGVVAVAMAFPETPIVYMSSEYAWNPVNYYGETKAAGEVALKAYSDKWLIIRTLFKPRPFPYEEAFKDQFTKGDYVDIIADLIANKVRDWDFTSKRIIVGTGRKSMYALARRTKEDVGMCSVDVMTDVMIPKECE